MNNEIKRQMEKIEVPEDLHERSKLGIMQVKQARKKYKRTSGWFIGVAASILFIGATFLIGGSHLTDAAETLLVKVFSLEEQEQIQEGIQKTAPDPEGGAVEAKAYLQQMEKHLQFAKEYLSPEEYEDYSRLIGDMMKIDMERIENPHADMTKLYKREEEILQDAQKYTDKLNALTNYTLEEAQEMVDFAINRPAYVPTGYDLEEEIAYTEEANPLEDPTITIKYGQTDGEFGFYLHIEKIAQDKYDELSTYDHIDSYELNGFAFQHAHDTPNVDTGNVQAMSVMIPGEEYEVIMVADILSKEEMEKVLLSMVEE
ncbi:hypothetical protein ACFSKI_06710 [Pseudogracilibacillus auburnensis]|uniref:DUF4367 domain-containing protein n=1 Tax=Pseudogracilibacillus auburnensis TaxID=1494959 RepID=A0A2V3VP82_9BACI|nr:hypothetical protein [Pseudogracilibacillus auburnensis]MBO1004119.1 hypothetical protein [Pseudogracilibacillus auburnensis]PXW83642.1 hypothetical protein DFR56_115115 [Pseudogracilibacillus auburnensis]